MATVPVREIELHAREYLAEIATAVIHERVGESPLAEIDERIRANIAAAETQRSRMLPLIERFAKVRDRIILKKCEGENFLAGVVQKKISELEANRLLLQLQIAKMQVAREILSRHTYAEEVRPVSVPALGAQEPRRLR